MASHRDSLQNLLEQGSMPLAAGTQNNGEPEGISGLDVILDGNILTNQGVGTSEDDVYVVDTGEPYLSESPLRTRVMQEVLSGTLQVRLQVYGYSAFFGSRRPAVVARISGTGLGAPTFPSS
jgi:hypothetical protein